MFLRSIILILSLLVLLVFLFIRFMNKDNTRIDLDSKEKEQNIETAEGKKDQAEPVLAGKKEASEKLSEKKPQVEKEPKKKEYKFERLAIDKNKPFAHIAKASPMTDQDKEAIEKLPEILQDSVGKYPETKDEILKFSTWKSDPKNYDITGVYEKGDIPRFIQWDSRWGFEPIGDSYMAHSACGPVVLSSTYIHFTGDTSMNPVEMSRWAENQGYYINGFGTSGYIFEKGAKDLGLSSYAIPFEMESIKNSLDAGDILVLHVTEGYFTTGGHYIMLIGYDEDDKLIIHDVNSPNNSQKKWDYDKIADQVTTVWCINE